MKPPAGDAGEPGVVPDLTADVPSRDAALVAAQLGRVPRPPWRVAARCTWGHPSAIVSPSRLSDGTPFPTLAWLTCPWLVQIASMAESAGGTALWSSRAAADIELRSQLERTDDAVRTARAEESGGDDACATVGIAGQRDPSGVKCLHAHIALALVGLDDPIGAQLLNESDPVCPDERCARLVSDALQHGIGAHTKEDV